MIARPPPSAAAATSSGLEQGYIAPQMIGYSTPASSVNLVLNNMSPTIHHEEIPLEHPL